MSYSSAFKSNKTANAPKFVVAPRSRFEISQIKSDTNSTWNYKVMRAGREDLFIVNDGTKNYSFSVSPDFSEKIFGKKVVNAGESARLKRLSNLSNDGVGFMKSYAREIGGGNLYVSKSSGSSLTGSIDTGNGAQPIKINCGEDGSWNISIDKTPEKVNLVADLMSKVNPKSAQQNSPRTLLDSLAYPILTPPGGSRLLSMGMASGIGMLGGGLFHLKNKIDAYRHGDKDEGSLLTRMGVGALFGAGANVAADLQTKMMEPSGERFDSEGKPVMNYYTGRPYRAPWARPGQKYRFSTQATPWGSNEIQNKTGALSDAVYHSIVPAMVLGSFGAMSLAGAISRKHTLDMPKLTKPQVRSIARNMDIEDVPIIEEGIRNAYYADPAASEFLVSESPDIKKKIIRDARGRRDRRPISELIQKGFIGHAHDYSRAPVIAHEGGHAQIENGLAGGLSKVNQKFFRPVSTVTMVLAPYLTSRTISKFRPYFGDLGKNVALDSLRGASVGATVGLIAGAPTLINELQASSRGIRALKQMGMPEEEIAKSRRALRSAFGTYLAAATLPSTIASAGMYLYGGLRRSGR